MLKAISSHLKKNAPPCHRIQATPLHQHYGIHTLGVRLIEQLSKEKICPDSLIETMGPCLLMLVFAGKKQQHGTQIFWRCFPFPTGQIFPLFFKQRFSSFRFQFPWQPDIQSSSCSHETPSLKEISHLKGKQLNRQAWRPPIQTSRIPLLLMVQKSHSQPPWMYTTLQINGIFTISTG